MGFMLAPRYHPAMKAVAPVRKALKFKTAFNILGPMLNPSRAPHSIVGVYHENLVRHLNAKVLEAAKIYSGICKVLSEEYPRELRRERCA